MKISSVARLAAAMACISLFSSCLFVADRLRAKMEEESSVTSTPSNPTFRFTKSGNNFGLSIADYMEEMPDLNKEAAISYGNIYKETYLIVLEEDIGVFKSLMLLTNNYDDALSPLQNYRLLQIRSMGENMKIKELSDKEDFKAGNLPGEIQEISGTVPGIPVDFTYVMGIIEGPEKIYMILTWTMKSRIDLYRSTFHTSIKTFRLIEGSVYDENPADSTGVLREEIENADPEKASSAS